MDSNADSRSPLVRFLDVFFQEQNIKWMLGTGMLILVGSSLMLVANHWESYTPVWKYLILLGYTAGLHLAGQFAYHSLTLRKTGTALMGLTVLLLPLTFLAPRWIHADGDFSLGVLFQNAGLTALFGLNVVFAAAASVRVFRHFLRGNQPTFLASYIILCLVGTIVPAMPFAARPWAALVLWGVFAAGAMKVNRHVFWLTEECRLPRVCGFFPILLLGGQYLALFWLNLARHIALEWIGLGCVLTAIPVLLTADALARVFRGARPRTPLSPGSAGERGWG